MSTIILMVQEQDFFSFVLEVPQQPTNAADIIQKSFQQSNDDSWRFL